MDLTAEPKCVAEATAVLGEGPIWVAREQALYWVDIKGRKIFRLERDGAQRAWETPYSIGSLAVRRDGGFIAGTQHGFATIDLDQDRFDVFADPEVDRPSNRFNDGKLDRAGRFWAGSMDDTGQSARGALYRLDHDRSWRRMEDGYRVTNGPAFSRCGRRMYHNDSARRVTFVFDLDDQGEPSNRRVFARYADEEGYPDGMTVDADDCLWIAFWDGWCVRRYSPEGRCLATISLPVQRPTSCVLGGEKLNQLYVTSASIGLSAAERDSQPCAGRLFMLDTGFTGLEDVPFDG